MLTVSDQHAIISSGTFSRYFGVPVPDKWANGLSELYLWYSQRKKIFYSSPPTLAGNASRPLPDALRSCRAVDEENRILARRI
jgi:hypothetical protein